MASSTAGTPIALAWSGGKDAAWALHTLRADPRWRVCALLTTVEADSGCVAVHRLPADVLGAQAAAVGLPLVEMPVPPMPANAVYASAFARALECLRVHEPALRHLAFGDLFLDDVHAFRVALCDTHRWQAIFPLWQHDTATLARRMLDAGLRATVCCVDTTQLDADIAGRAFDHTLLQALPDGVDPCGERGEFHTCAWDGPMFEAPLALRWCTAPSRADRFMYATPERLR